MKTPLYGSMTRVAWSGTRRAVVLAGCCLVLLAAATAPKWAPEMWPGKATERLSFEEALDLVASPDVTEGNRMNGAGRLMTLMKKAIYEMRLARDSTDTPEGLKLALKKYLLRLEMVPSEPIPQRWLDRRK